MQLKLFSGKVTRSLKVGQRKKVTSPTQRNIPEWNLWTQGSTNEKEMALLFLDIRNFTPLVEAHVPQDVIQIIKKLFVAFQNIIQAHHGRIIETTGDGFYAAFGFDHQVNTSVNDAVQSGFAMINTLEMLNTTSFERNLKRKIEIGIGIHAGKVATGNIHLGKEDHHVVMGFPVNIASRLQAATKELNNNFIVSSAVFNLLSSPPAHSSANVSLKGVSDRFQVHLIGKAYADTIDHQMSMEMVA